MKTPTTLLAFIISFSVAAQHEHDATPSQTDTLKKSIPKEVHAQIGENQMVIQYHAPAVRERVIWGGLVPYGEVWVTGAHSATSFEFNKDIIVDNTIIQAGKYAIFTVPGKEKWTIIINKNWDQHLADKYDAKDDVIRVEGIPQSLSVNQERLLYSITPKSNKEGLLSISWEKIKVVLPFTIK